MASGRGETKVGSARLQNVGSTAQSRLRGGAIIPRSEHVEATLPGITPQTAGNYGIVWTTPSIGRQVDLTGAVPPLYEVELVRERHEVAGTDAGAVTLDIYKVPSGTAKAAGTSILTAPLSLKTTANTNQDGALSATLTAIQLADGDSLALILTGTPTALVGVSVEFSLRRI